LKTFFFENFKSCPKRNNNTLIYCILIFRSSRKVVQNEFLPLLQVVLFGLLFKFRFSGSYALLPRPSPVFLPTFTRLSPVFIPSFFRANSGDAAVMQQ